MRTTALFAVLVLSSACSDDSSSSTSASAAATSTTAVSTTAVPTTAPPTAPHLTIASTTTAAVGTTAPSDGTACEPFGSLDDQQANFPGTLTSAVGVDIRTGAHPCYERIVIELAPFDAPTPGGMPGYWVRYADGPITLGQSDDIFVELRGDADLLITLGAWMYEVDANGNPIGYAGNIDVFPTNVSTIEEILLIDNSEGVQNWAVGLDEERPFVVTTLTNPDRLVIDIAL
jgi:hypothetical protein